jgi:threonine dehydrogenase-like Zn-dependent dehydrogenase
VKALVVDPDAKQVKLTEIAKPEPGPGEALVQVRQAGICGTDLEIVQGYMTFSGVLGHEFVGRVERCDDDPSWVDKRVVGELNCACGDCESCRRGHPRHCANRSVLGIENRDGAFAEYVTLPVANLHAVPDTVGDEHAVFTEPLAAALEILAQVAVQPSQDVLLIGDGRLAQLCGQVLALTGCRLTVVGKHESKLALLRSRGAHALLLDDLEDERFDVVVEATGSPAAAELAIEHCRPRGTVVLKTTVAGPAGLPVTPVVINEITLVGSRCGDFEPALRLLAQGRIAVSGLVSGIYPLDKAVDAFEYARGREVMKVLIDMVHDA